MRFDIRDVRLSSYRAGSFVGQFIATHIPTGIQVRGGNGIPDKMSAVVYELQKRVEAHD